MKKKLAKCVVVVGAMSSPAFGQILITGSAMPLQSSGTVAANNGWDLTSDGYVGTYISLSQAAPVTFTVNAAGTASSGLNPDMTLSIADSNQSFNVSSSSLNNYTYTTPTLAAGTYFVRTQLDNQTATQTPSLDVGSLTVAGTGVSVLSGNTATEATNAATTYATNYRAGPGTIALTNANGIHLGAGTSVQVKLISNAFSFAGAVYGQSPFFQPSQWLNYNTSTGVNSAPTSTEQMNYQNAIKANFNMIVPENAGKWVNDEYTQGSPDMVMVDAMAQFASQNGLRMRMHNLIWGTEQPNYVSSLFSTANGSLTAGNASTLNSYINSRIGYYVSGKNSSTLNTPRADSYSEMDVLNEPWHSQAPIKTGTVVTSWDDYINSGALGVSGVANIYTEVENAVKAAGANTRLYTNEFNVLQFSPQSVSSTGQEVGSDAYANWYLNGIQGLQRSGAPIGGIGMELYTNPSSNVDPVQMQKAMQNLSVAKDPNGNPMPLALTEFGDSGGTSVANYDTDLSTALTMAYGDPQTDTFGYWGGIGGPNDLGDGSTSLYNSSYQLTATGTVWQSFMNQINTNVILTTNAAGQITFNGTYGLYDVIVGGQTYQLNLVKGTTNYGLMTPISTDTWNGGGTDNNWSTSANWVSSSFAANAPLVFAGTTRLASNNNTTANTEYDGITFNFGAGAFVITGNAINLAGDIVNNSSNLQTINTALAMQTNTNFNAASGDLAIGGAISGTFSLTKLGTHTLSLSGSDTYSGGTALTNGTIKVGATNALPVATTVTFGTATTNGVLDLNGQSQQIGGLAVAAAVPTASIPLQTIGNSSHTSPATLQFNSAGSSTFAGTIVDAINGGNQTTALAVTGGLLALTGLNTYSGGTAIAGGTLQLGATSALPAATTVTFGSATTNGVLDLNGHIQQVGGLAVAAAVPFGSLSSQVIGNSSQTNSATLLFNSTGSSTFGGVIKDAIGTGNQTTSVSVSGGSLTLTNSNTYSGSTTINGGTLLAGAANSLSPNSQINDGTGGALDVSSSPNQIPGLLFGASATLNLGIGNILTDTGSATFGGTLNVAGFPSGSTVELMSYTSDSGTFTNVPTFAGYNLVYGSTELELVASGPANLTWTNASTNNLWNTAASANWNNGTSTTVFHAQDNVTFNDNNPSNTPTNYSVTLNSTVSPGSVTVNNSLATYTILGTGTIAGAGSLTKSGTGTLILATPNTYTGGTIVTAGRLTIEPTSSTTSALPTGTLSISGNGIVQLADNVTAGTALATSNVNLKSLTLTGDGTLDIGNNRIIIDYTSPATDPIASIAAWIKNGFYGLPGPAIISGDVAADDSLTGLSYGIGYADGADGLIAGLPSGEIEIMYTLLGDANLDGTVNTEDFTPFSNNVGQSGGWDDGDFNYDGSVNTEDFTPFSADLNQSAIYAAQASVLNSPVAPSNSISLTNVPEPATAGMMVMAGSGILRRRRRSSRCAT